MGFPEIRAKRALLKTGNSGAESAMEWLFSHMEHTGKFHLARVIAEMNHFAY